MKRIVLLLCILLVMLPVLAAAENETYEYVGNMEIVNCSEWVSLRETPNTGAKRLAKVSLGASVSGCYAVDDEWYYAEYDGYVGYILAKYLQPCEGISTFSAMLITNCETSSTDLYPTIDAMEPIDSIYEDTIVRNCAMMGNGRVYVEYGDRCGFVDGENAVAYSEMSHFPRKMTLMTNLYDDEFEGPPAVLKADYTQNFPLEEYNYTEYEYECVAEDEERPRLEFVLYSDSMVNHVHLFSTELMVLDEATGEAEYELTLEDIQYEMAPEHPLSVTTVVYGDTPNLAVGYQDWTGAYHFAFVEISGEDGSLILREF